MTKTRETSSALKQPTDVYVGTKQKFQEKHSRHRNQITSMSDIDWQSRTKQDETELDRYTAIAVTRSKQTVSLVRKVIPNNTRHFMYQVDRLATY
jgi:hypothetical protein